MSKFSKKFVSLAYSLLAFLFPAKPAKTEYSNTYDLGTSETLHTFVNA